MSVAKALRRDVQLEPRGRRKVSAEQEGGSMRFNLFSQVERRSLLIVVAALPFLACSSAPQSNSASSANALGSGAVSYRPFCGAAPAPGAARCLSIVRTNKSTGQIQAFASPIQGYGPSDLQSAYGLPSSGGQGVTVAIVDAQDDPNAEADLAVYRKQYGLPPCTTANGCFTKVDQSGGTNYPSEDDGWSGEISLDLDMVSAVCPQCNILLVEANSPDFSDFGVAVATAASLGAKAISNSYGGGEDSSVTTEEAAYHQPGVSVTVSNGDYGYGAQFPASSQYVIAVGGTSLSKDSSARGWTETVWGSGTSSAESGGTGSGCSAFITKPSWQKDTGCSNRTVGDVSAVADPNTGMAVYDTENAQSSGEGTGWIVVGGTSASSPIVAATLALTGLAGTDASFFYANPGATLNDVVSGSNGTCSPNDYLCTGEAGYDGPTGWGTPIASSWSGSTPPPPPPPPVDAGTDASSDDGGGGDGDAGGDACTGVPDGTYCGGDGVSGDPGTLYTCAGGSLASSSVCSNGCYADGDADGYDTCN
jgi:hypothetical protein